jgi:CHAT domain-containing protein
MGAFYRYFVAGNQTKTRALQLAMQEVKEQYNPPYHWAPFVLIGDWK